MKKYSYLFLVILVVSAGFCIAAPSPAVVQSAQDWTLEVKYEHPQQIQVSFEGQKHPVRFWYIIMTILNQTSDDVDFYPECELVTDTFQIVPASVNVPLSVFDQIKLRHQKQYPFLESVDKTSSKVLQGPDNVKDIAIIWSDFDPNAKNVSFFIAGLSNETIALDHPTAKDENGNSKKIFLRKTLGLDYKIGGDPIFRSDAILKFKEQNWIMR
ncbi:MAG TPA: hypothetical protein PLP05_07140 [Sedimentisphaerales bacterium]|nr:hypothetical protein [Sedimentisphaerales bacterium]